MTNPNTENMWKVRCACGSEAFVSQTDLTNGKVTSCGCDGKEYFRCQTDNGLVISSTPIVTCTGKG